MNQPVYSIVLLAICIILGCQNTDRTTKKEAQVVDDISTLGALPEQAPAPKNNPITPAKVELGRLLFYDPILSGHKDVACVSCHLPQFGYSESLEISIGVGGKGTGSNRHFTTPNDIPFVKRNSQSVINAAFNGIDNSGNANVEQAPMFWDLRAKSLEKQSLEPIKSFEEMRGHAYEENKALPTVVERLKAIPEYQKLFSLAFGNNDAINIENLAKALATFERTIISTNTRFDQFMRGDKTQLSENEQLGLQAFLKSGCAKCHNGPMFSDFKLHTIGVADNDKLPKIDDGTNKKFDFRTPSLRSLRFTFPYMHNGKIKTLEQVLEFYEDLSGRKIQNPHVQVQDLDPLTKHLDVEFKEISLIVEFLNTLSNDDFDKTAPTKVPSGLKVGGNID